MSGKFAEKLDSAMVHQITAWIGVFGFMVGLTAFLIVRMWFEKAIDDFNKAIIAQGDKGPHLIASAGNGFISAYLRRLATMCANIFFSGLGRVCLLRYPSHRVAREDQRASDCRQGRVNLSGSGFIQDFSRFQGSFGHSQHQHSILLSANCYNAKWHVSPLSRVKTLGRW